MTSLRFVGDLPLWIGLVLASVVCVLSWRYYRRESFDLPHRLRWFLPLLRSLAFFLGVMVLTGPVLHHRKIIGELGRVTIYVDASQSMGLLDRHLSDGRKLLIAERQDWLEPGRVDGSLLKLADDDEVQLLIDAGDESIRAALAMFDETPRWRRAERSLLDTSDALFADLKQHHNVEVIALHAQAAVQLLDGINTAALATSLAASPDGTTTDLASGIASSQKSATQSEPEATASDSEKQTAKPTAAVVLLTDGQHNSGPSPLQTARVLGGQGVPFYPVSFGANQPAPDIAVTGLEYPEMVFQRDRVRGTMIVRDLMPLGQPLVAEIAYEGEVLWQQQLLTQNTGTRRIEFEFGIEELVKRLGNQFESDVQRHAVSLAMTASIAPLQGEAEPENNQRTMRLAAITENYRLLIIDGRSRWETRYLRNAFERDSQWDLNVVITGHGADGEMLPRGSGKDQFPETRDGLFDFDMIIFGEVAPDIFADHELAWIREFVETRGGGLVFVDGQRGRLQQYTEQNLRQLLPVEWLPAAISTQPTMLQLTDAGSREPALTIEVETQANQRFWSELPTPHTLNSVEALPGAEVLVEALVDGSLLPAMVTRRFGAGRVLYLGFDETWRWRYKAADTYHQRIWNQLAKFVMPRPFA
ncbi:MAG TPA: hypothetical protein VMM76_24735, partial [Pirellulaceae bacterium]|nr:hypothetical protein [Pirellulaceae bacterium]